MIEDRTIAPGKKGGFTWKIETSRLAAGPLARYADVITNDPRQPRMRVCMSGKVEVIFAVDPAKPRILTLRGKGPDILEVTLRKKIQGNLKVPGARSRSGHLLVQLSEVEPGAAWKLQAKTNYKGTENQYYFSELVIVDVQAGERRVPQEIWVSVQL